MTGNFIDDYLAYTWETEPPRIFHRWSAIGILGAAIGRKARIEHGMFHIFPNMYIKLLGDAGTRKSTAVKIARKILSSAGYDTFSADKTRLEKFLLDLEGGDLDDEAGIGIKSSKYDAVLASNLWGNDTAMDAKECFICADEWNDFAPRGDIDFCTLLGNLWDWDDDSRPYSYRLKNSKSVAIMQPTISILSGNTPEGFSKAFPVEMIGTGFLSRLILIHGDKSNRKYTIPPVPSEEKTNAVRLQLQTVRSSHYGSIQIEQTAFELLDAIYNGWEDLDDVRFKSYSNRRFTQLLKLCLICAISSGTRTIQGDTVIRANTYLSAAEVVMPRGLGEFGKGKNSDVANKIMEILLGSHKPLGIADIWKLVHSDLDKITQLGELLQGLQAADKAQCIAGSGWLPKRKRNKLTEFVDLDYLTEEERQGLDHG